MGQFDRFQRFRQRADLVDLDQDGIGRAALKAHGQALGIGHEEVVADQLAAVADHVGENAPALPVILGHAVLDGDDGVAVDQVFEIFRHTLAIEGLALAGHDIFAVLVEFGGGGIERQRDILARRVAGGLDGLHDEGDRLVGGIQARREAAFIADIGVVTGGVELFLQGVEHFRAHPHGVGDARRGDRHDHEFLDVDRVVGMLAAIDDVHHRGRQDAGIDAADIAVERQAAAFRRRLGHGQRDAEHGIGAEAGLVVGAVHLDHQLVDQALVGGIEAFDGLEDLAIDRLAGLFNALAAKAGRLAVAQLMSLIGAGRSTRGHGGAAGGAVAQGDVHLDGGIAPAVQDFAGENVDDLTHAFRLPKSAVGRIATRIERLPGQGN